jgi:N-dimethylarginine dimethylaminohydrolase
MLRLMCPPTYFDIEYSINPWMDVNNKVDHELAHQQWNDFVDTLRELGDEIEFIEPAPGLPDMTFSGDPGMVYNNCFIPSNFRAKERAGEVEHYIKWFRERGYTIKQMPSEIFFEGLGDLVFHNNLAIVGHGCRSDERAIAHLKEMIPALRILGGLKILDDHYFHLAMALGFIDEETVLYYPPAFDDASNERLKAMVKYPIAVSDEDANSYFACNNLVIGNTVLLDNCTESLRGALAERGYITRACPMSEFKKSGGSLRCLVLSFINGPET